MSRYATSVVLGYHGRSRDVGLKALNEGLPLEPSDKDYDWLGPGVYFWEGDPRRAFEWAKDKASRGAYKEPFVIGAVIDPGNGLDLLVRENIELLTVAYEGLAKFCRKAGVEMPKSKDPGKINKGDKLLRFLDCAVIRHLHQVTEDPEFNPPSNDDDTEPFDTVRGLFVAGRRAYAGGGFFTKTHTQIAVRSDRCIKGMFLPRGDAMSS